MSEKINIDLGQFEGRSFKIGRDGHIYINSPMVSQQHAEIRIIRGRVYLLARPRPTSFAVVVSSSEPIILYLEVRDRARTRRPRRTKSMHCGMPCPFSY